MRALAHFWDISRLEGAQSLGEMVLERLLLWLCSYRCALWLLGLS